MCCARCSDFIDSPYTTRPHEDLRKVREEDNSVIYGCQSCFTFFEFAEDAIYLMEQNHSEAATRACA